MKGMVSKGIFEAIEFIHPSIELQNDFAKTVLNNQSVIEFQKQSLKALQALYDTTSQNIF
jgi:restriction endonuclease S subunit